MSSKYPIVVQGEASETDSDDEVQGEASETDSEDEVETADRSSALTHESTKILQRDLPPLIVVRDHPDIQSVVEDRPSPTHKPFGDTLLQQKLQESNSRLYTDVGQMLRNVYGSASKEVRSATAQLNTSQSAIINASHSIRLILDDLKSVSEKIDIITTCQILPDIKMNHSDESNTPAS
ncbi:biogenesis of lysosome-related organelles complex 1 subunit 3 isoform X2 [Corythoichthys intestinalis]|uniref:biogenesis of lysosome-related organelles complex 1 subunit 3 isoform X2 n=1 Tax=Corythoichthys intestinalis TaxID=161448 RepID=UPI0025A567C3|nr:biogenesis of lysosome-related organelles complex 1 subunit 3 isoform X2 [Corythoichthys intestinalis]